MTIIDRIKELNAEALAFGNRYAPQILGLIALVLMVVLYNQYSGIGEDKPKIAKEFAKTSVMIMAGNMRSGGSGVVLRSSVFDSEILTNKHICRLVERGGYVLKDGERYLVKGYKKYPYHDLCLVKVQYGFGVNTKISNSKPEDFSKAFISGHPALLPHVLTTGNFSKKKIINLAVGLRKCKDKDWKGKRGLYCLFFGGLPILQSFEAQLVTGTILPGSSGSGIFNSDGEISGLVFAGRGGDGLSYAFAVPQEYIRDFMEIEQEIPWTITYRTNYRKIFRRIFDFRKTCEKPEVKTKFRKFCNSFEDRIIWEQ